MAETGANIAGSLTVQIGAPLDKFAADLAKAEQLASAYNLKIDAALAKGGGNSITKSVSSLISGLTAPMAAVSAPAKEAAASVETFAKSAGHATTALGLNRIQMLELTHVGRELATMFAQGVNPMRAFTMESGRIATFFQMGEGGLGATFVRFLPIIGAVAGAFAVAGLALDAFKDKLNQGHTQALGFIDVLKGVGITAWDAFKSGFDGAPEWFRGVWDKMGTVTGDAINNLIQQFAIFSAQLNENMKELPDDILSGIQGVANLAIDWLNHLTDGVNALGRALARVSGQTAVEPSQQDIDKTHIKPLAFGDGANTDAAKLRDDLNKKVADIMGTNYLPQIYKNGLPSNDNAKTSTKETAYQRETAALQRQLAALTQTDREQEISNALASAHVKAATQEGQAITELAGKYYDQKKAIDDANQAANFFAQTTETAFQNVIDGSESLTNALGDLLKALAQAVLQSALLGSGPLAGLMGTSPATSASAGGILGSIFSAILPGHAMGTANTGGTRGVPAGIVHGQEAVIPLPSGGRIPVQVIGGAANGNGGGTMHVELAWSQDSDGNIAPIIKSVSQSTTAQAIGQYDSSMPEKVHHKALAASSGRGAPINRWAS